MAGSSIKIIGCSPSGVLRRLADAGYAGCRETDPGTCTASLWKFGAALSFTPDNGAPDRREIESLFAPFCLAREMESPAEPVVAAALNAGVLFAMAESCTGGLAGALVTEISGSSRVFWGSMVTYANAAKERVLGVDTLAAHGAVSIPTAEAMAAGALALSESRGAVSITGIAGPDGGTPEKPVGTVCFAFAVGGTIRSLRCRFSGNRARIRRQAAALACAGLANEIEGALLDIGWIAEYTFD